MNKNDQVYLQENNQTLKKPRICSIFFKYLNRKIKKNWCGKKNLGKNQSLFEL